MKTYSKKFSEYMIEFAPTEARNGGVEYFKSPDGVQMVRITVDGQRPWEGTEADFKAKFPTWAKGIGSASPDQQKEIAPLKDKDTAPEDLRMTAQGNNSKINKIGKDS